MAHQLADLAAQLRVDSVRCTTAAGSGHPTSALSAADTCMSGECRGCSQLNCNGGCCTAAGDCVAGTADIACGVAGQSCVACPSGQACDTFSHTCH